VDKPSPPPETLVTCEECLYYDALTDEKGNCRRYAPRPTLLANDRVTTQWPIVQVYDSCGDARSIHS